MQVNSRGCYEAGRSVCVCVGHTHAGGFVAVLRKANLAALKANDGG